MNRSPTKHEFRTKMYREKLEKDSHDENALLRNYKGCIQEFTFQASK